MSNDSTSSLRQARDALLGAARRFQNDRQRFRQEFLYAARAFVQAWNDGSSDFRAELERRASFVQKSTAKGSLYARATSKVVSAYLVSAEEEVQREIPQVGYGLREVCERVTRAKRIRTKREWPRHIFATGPASLEEEVKLWDRAISSGCLGRPARRAYKAALLVVKTGRDIIADAKNLAADGVCALRSLADDTDEFGRVFEGLRLGLRGGSAIVMSITSAADSLLKWAETRNNKEGTHPRQGKWHHVWKLIQAEGAEKGIGTDQAIANKHNKQCAIRIGNGDCRKITAQDVAQVRYEYTHRDRHRKQKHKKRS